jgi:diketogulonate reductase-like aldo/keto reductase
MLAASSPFSKPCWRIGLGTYRLAASTQGLVSRALSLGWRHIDTAALYRNEAAVGAAIRASGLARADLFVTTKIHVHDIARLRIAEATERALKHLGEIDLMLLHNWTPQAPEAWAMLAQEAERGRIRCIGVSNFGAKDLAQLPSPRPCVNQIEFSPFLQRWALREAMSGMGVTAVAHSALTKGRRLSEIAAVLARICPSMPPRHTPAQLLLAWSLARGAIPLACSGDERRLRENLSALDIAPDPSELACLDALEDGFVTHPRAQRD